jgi:hypothetical protein
LACGPQGKGYGVSKAATETLAQSSEKSLPLRPYQGTKVEIQDDFARKGKTLFFSLVPLTN